MISSRFTDDPIQYQGQRKRLVNQLKKKGIVDERVLAAISEIPRHSFMESGFIRFAYQDQAFPINAGQTISQPYTVAFQSELLEIEEHQKVLEIGTGSGYQTAVLSEMGARVFTIERIKSLHLSATALLKELGFVAQCFYGDGYQGLPSYGPFDRILITAGANEVPEELKKQLKPNGILVAPIGDRTHQKMLKIRRMGESEYEISDHGGFVFVPMLGGKSDE
jgi:protein-L-isoaspartate(D-aspartate) O-methyltransferase